MAELHSVECLGSQSASGKLLQHMPLEEGENVVHHFICTKFLMLRRGNGIDSLGPVGLHHEAECALKKCSMC